MQKATEHWVLLFSILLTVQACGGGSSSENYVLESDLYGGRQQVSPDRIYVLNLENHQAIVDQNDSGGAGRDSINFSFPETEQRTLELQSTADSRFNAELKGLDGTEVLQASSQQPGYGIVSAGEYQLIVSHASPGDHSYTVFVREGSSVISQNCNKCSLPSLEIPGWNIDHVSFSKADLQNANLRNVSCASTDFQAAKLNGADFSGAACPGANFAGADLSGVSFAGADLSGANFDQAIVADDTDLTGANLSGTQLLPPTSNGLQNITVIQSLIIKDFGDSMEYGNVDISPGGYIELWRGGHFSIENLNMQGSEPLRIYLRAPDGLPGSPGLPGTKGADGNNYQDSLSCNPGRAGIAGTRGEDGTSGADVQYTEITIRHSNVDITVIAKGGNGGSGGKGGDGGAGGQGSYAVWIEKYNQLRPACNGGDGGGGGNGGNGGDGGSVKDIRVFVGNGVNVAVVSNEGYGGRGGVRGIGGRGGWGGSGPSRGKNGQMGLAGLTGASGAAGNIGSVGFGRAN